MRLGNLKRLVHALLDRYRRHDDDELRETVAFVQLENRPQVDIRLPRTRLHLHGKVPGIQGHGGRQAVAELDGLQVIEDFLIEQGQPVADAEVAFGESEPRLGLRRVSRDGELGPADLLPAEQIAHRLNCLELEVEIGFEVEFHGGSE